VIRATFPVKSIVCFLLIASCHGRRRPAIRGFA
jgi:hypothetical protein